MKFREGPQTVFTADERYDLFVTERIKPENFLANLEDIKKVRDAMGVVDEFLEESYALGLIEVYENKKMEALKKALEPFAEDPGD